MTSPKETKPITPSATDPPAEDKSKAADGDKPKDAKADEAEELSEEDQRLKDDLEMLVSRLLEDDETLYLPTLAAIKDSIKTSTSSMTAVPKPLKFLRPHYSSLGALYDKWIVDSDKLALADTLSVLGMTYSDEAGRDTLKYRLLSPSKDIGSWGHEYMRHLALQLGEEYHARSDDAHTDDLTELAKSLIPFFLKHNAEPDAVDVLSELEMIEEIQGYLDEGNYARVCLYMLSMVPLLPYPDNDSFLRTVCKIYGQYKQYTRAMVAAIRLNDEILLREIFDSTDDQSVKRQMALLMARQRVPFEFTDAEKFSDESLEDCFNNTELSTHFQSLGKELNILEVKTPADIYKSHLKQTPLIVNLSESSTEVLADAFVNGFVNAGFGSNPNVPEETSGPKTHINVSIAASHGLLHLWRHEKGTDVVDDLLAATTQTPTKAGLALALGLVNSSVLSPEDSAYACLKDFAGEDEINEDVRCASIMALGISYAGSCNRIFFDQLREYITEPSYGIRVASMAALALGLTFVGSADGDIAEAILTTCFDTSPEREAHFTSKWMCFMSLGLGLLYLGRQEDVDVVLESLKAVENPVAQSMALLVDICAWAGTGNVLKIQQLLQICSDAGSSDAEPEGNQKTLQSYAVIGMGLVAMGEDVGQEMYIRQLGHLMHYGTPAIRKAVPLALALLLPSNPQMKVYDTLSRYTHDKDLEVATNAIFAMGVVGAGTSNARLASLLRQLSSFYSRDSTSLFMVKFSQGLLHLGKGTISLNPFHTDRQVMSRVGAAGLLTVMIALAEDRKFVLDKSHYLLYNLVPSMYPRFLTTLDEDLKPLVVNVRVGQAVDVAGQAGRPRTITGWQTQSTPVLLSHGERAELEDEKYISLSAVLEGIVILRQNPDYVE